MTTLRFTRQTTQDLQTLAELLAEKEAIEKKAEKLKWRILDRREINTQTAVADLYGVSRQAIGQQVKAREEERIQREERREHGGTKRTRDTR